MEITRTLVASPSEIENFFKSDTTLRFYEKIGDDFYRVILRVNSAFKLKNRSKISDLIKKLSVAI